MNDGVISRRAARLTEIGGKSAAVWLRNYRRHLKFITALQRTVAAIRPLLSLRLPALNHQPLVGDTLMELLQDIGEVPVSHTPGNQQTKHFPTRAGDFHHGKNQYSSHEHGGRLRQPLTGRQQSPAFHFGATDLTKPLSKPSAIPLETMSARYFKRHFALEHTDPIARPLPAVMQQSVSREFLRKQVGSLAMTENTSFMRRRIKGPEGLVKAPLRRDLLHSAQEQQTARHWLGTFGTKAWQHFIKQAGGTDAAQRDTQPIDDVSDERASLFTCAGEGTVTGPRVTAGLLSRYVESKPATDRSASARPAKESRFARQTTTSDSLGSVVNRLRKYGGSTTAIKHSGDKDISMGAAPTSPSHPDTVEQQTKTPYSPLSGLSGRPSLVPLSRQDHAETVALGVARKIKGNVAEEVHPGLNQLLWEASHEARQHKDQVVPQVAMVAATDSASVPAAADVANGNKKFRVTEQEDLAREIKRILDEEARRHGINV